MWKTVRNYPSYQVSCDGRVRGKRKELKQITNRFGIKHVPLYLSIYGVRKGRCEDIHKLVAEAFLSGDGPVYHIGEPGNNHVDNLTRIKPIEIPADVFYLEPCAKQRFPNMNCFGEWMVEYGCPASRPPGRVDEQKGDGEVLSNT